MFSIGIEKQYFKLSFFQLVEISIKQLQTLLETILAPW